MRNIFLWGVSMLLCVATLPLPAQEPLFGRPGDLAYRLAASEVRLDSAQTGALSFELDNISFFKDNEFEGEQAKGYSLPGLWLQPRLTYQPLPSVRIEAGLHAVVFSGAGKYPCYAYHDIGRWKGDQYQRGAHVLPFFRAQAQLKNVTLVLGNLYGGANHRVMEPLMNPEVNLTQDPEMGFQLLLRLRRYELDAWVNWQSYIFEEETHQEAFTVGLHQLISLNGAGCRWHWYLPVDILVQHRGGEQDATDTGVQTITNGGVGVGLRWRVGSRALQSLTAEAAALGCWQQAGRLWPFDTGLAGSASLSAQFSHGFRVFAGAFYARHFVSLYGVPFYGTLSQKHEGARFSQMLTPHVGLEWSHAFTDDYVLGAKADAYPLRAGRLTLADGTRTPSAFAGNFSFGVFFRCRPRFLLRRFSR